MYLTGGPLTAAEAYRLGAIEEIVPDGSEFGRPMTVAHQIARMSPIAIRISKRALDAAEGMPIGEGYQLEQECTLRQGATADAREGIAAFREERSPVWTAAELRAEYLRSGSVRNGLPRIICTASGGTPGTTAAAVTWLDSATVEDYNKDMFHLTYAEDRWPR
jgi:hypothetical protein